MKQSVRLVVTGTVLALASSTSVGALETTATGNPTDIASSMGLSALQAMLMAAFNSLKNSIDTCAKDGKLYAPTSPGKDANGCISIATPTQVCADKGLFYSPGTPGADADGCVDLLPDNADCDVGSPILNNGTKWTCTKTSGSIYVGGASVVTSAMDAQKICVDRGFDRYYTYTATGGGCNGCYYMAWNGSAWIWITGCPACTTLSTVTCY